jgi:hypothetical protein
MTDDGPDDPQISLYVRQYIARVADAGREPTLRDLRKQALKDQCALGRQQVLDAVFYRTIDAARRAKAS